MNCNNRSSTASLETASPLSLPSPLRTDKSAQMSPTVTSNTAASGIVPSIAVLWDASFYQYLCMCCLLTFILFMTIFVPIFKYCKCCINIAVKSSFPVLERIIDRPSSVIYSYKLVFQHLRYHKFTQPGNACVTCET